MDPSRIFRVALLRLRSLLGRTRVEQELDDELRDHLEAQIQDLTSRGLTPQAARTEALRALGGVESVKEECRDRRRVGAVENTMRDLAYGARILRRTPAFTAVAILSLALGIGANTAIFQLLDAVRLRTLAVTGASDLAIVEIKDRGWPGGDYSGQHAYLTNPQWERIRDRQQAFSGIFAWMRTSFDLSGRGESRFSENGLFVSGGFFETLGVAPAAGRLLGRADDVRGCADPGVVVSHGFWKRELGGRESAIGSRLSINSRLLPVVGVSAEGFYGVEVGRAFDLAVPLCAEPLLQPDSDRLTLNNRWFLAVMGRLKSGSTLEQASAQLAGISRDIFAETVPQSFSPEAQKQYRDFKLIATPGAAGFSTLRGTYDTPLSLLLALAGIVLVIACANLANLMLARVSAREREISVRLALGASRGRVVRQLFVESLLLGLLGAAAAAWVAPVLAQSVIAMISSTEAPLFLDLSRGWRVLAFTSALAIATTVLFGLAPALRGTRVPIEQALRASARSVTPGGSRLTLRRALVVAQLAMSMVLLVGGLFFARTLYNLTSEPAGFDREGVLEADVDMTRLDLSQAAIKAHRARILETLRAAPSVRSAAVASTVPLVGIWSGKVYIDGTRRDLQVSYNRISPGYFATLGTPLVAGRDMRATDDETAPLVAIVNEAFAAQLMPGEGNIVGRTFQRENGGAPDKPMEIIGIAGNTKYRSLRDEPMPIAYFSQGQASAASAFITYFIRVDGPAAAARAQVKQALEGYDVPLAFHFHDFNQQIGYSILRERLMAWLCGFFAVLAAVLAIVGVYGVIAYSVQQRRIEIGVRLALGATRGAVLTLVMREAAWLLVAGLAIGLALAWSASGIGASMLFGVAPSDPLVYLSAASILAVSALAATMIPAWRATRSGPLSALRAE